MLMRRQTQGPTVSAAVYPKDGLSSLVDAATSMDILSRIQMQGESGRGDASAQDTWPSLNPTLLLFLISISSESSSISDHITLPSPINPFCPSASLRPDRPLCHLPALIVPEYSISKCRLPTHPLSVKPKLGWGRLEFNGWSQGKGMRE